MPLGALVVVLITTAIGALCGAPLIGLGAGVVLIGVVVWANRV